MPGTNDKDDIARRVEQLKADLRFHGRQLGNYAGPICAIPEYFKRAAASGCLYQSVDAATAALNQSRPLDEAQALRIENSRLRAQRSIDQQAIERLTEERDMLAQRRAAEVKELLALKHPAPAAEPHPIAEAIAAMQRAGIR